MSSVTVERPDDYTVVVNVSGGGETPPFECEDDFHLCEYLEGLNVTDFDAESVDRQTQIIQEALDEFAASSVSKKFISDGIVARINKPVFIRPEQGNGFKINNSTIELNLLADASFTDANNDGDYMVTVSTWTDLILGLDIIGILDCQGNANAIQINNVYDFSILPEITQPKKYGVCFNRSGALASHGTRVGRGRIKCHERNTPMAQRTAVGVVSYSPDLVLEEGLNIDWPLIAGEFHQGGIDIAGGHYSMGHAIGNVVQPEIFDAFIFHVPYFISGRGRIDFGRVVLGGQIGPDAQPALQNFTEWRNVELKFRHEVSVDLPNVNVGLATLDFVNAGTTLTGVHINPSIVYNGAGEIDWFKVNNPSNFDSQTVNNCEFGKRSEFSGVKPKTSHPVKRVTGVGFVNGNNRIYPVDLTDRFIGQGFRVNFGRADLYVDANASDIPTHATDSYINELGHVVRLVVNDVSPEQRAVVAYGNVNYI